jgi:hypothetical protein
MDQNQHQDRQFRLNAILVAVAVCFGVILYIFHNSGVIWAVGVAIVVIAGIVYAHSLNSRIARLRKDGIKVPATIKYIGLEVLDNAAVKGTHYTATTNLFKIYCTGSNPNTNQPAEFISNNLYFEPDLQLNNTPIDVYVDRDNPNDYWVDISQIKQRDNGILADKTLVSKYKENGLYKSSDGINYIKSE